MVNHFADHGQNAKIQHLPTMTATFPNPPTMIQNEYTALSEVSSIALINTHPFPLFYKKFEFPSASLSSPFSRFPFAERQSQ